MRSDRLRLSRALQHEQLRHDSDRLQEDRERPKNFRDLEAVVEYEGEEDTGSNEVFDAEGVDGGVVCWPEAVFHEVEDVAAAGYEEYLHGEVV